MTNPDIDQIALDVARRFTMDYEPQRRASLQVAVIDAIRKANHQPAGGEAVAGRVCGYTPGMAKVEIQLEGGPLPDWLELGEAVHVSTTPPAAQVQHCPECKFTMSGLAYCPNCHPAAQVQQASDDDRKLAEEGLFLFERNGDAGDKLYVEAIRRCMDVQVQPCDMGALCIGCTPRNADGSCPEAAHPAA